MTQSERKKHFDLTPDAKPVPRPQIWLEGRQRPRFDIAAFARTSLGMAKRALAPEIVDAAGRLDHLGHLLQRGELRANVTWAGRAGRLVPSSRTVGAWALSLGSLLRGAHDLLVPPEGDGAELAYPNLARNRADLTNVPPDAGPALVPNRPKVEPTLHAIRSAIQNSPHEFGHETRKPPETAPDPDRPPSLGARIRSALRQAGSHVVLTVFLGFALPAGMIRAVIFHLDGGDLADWS